MTSTKMKRKKPYIHYAWIIVLSGCAFMGTTLGMLSYTVGNFFLPVSREFECGIADVSMYVTISSLSIAVFIPVVRRFIEHYTRRSLTFGAVLIIAALAGLSEISDLWQMYLWAVCLGAGSSFFNGATVPALVNSWFAKRKGTALGICLASAALIGAMMNPVLAGIIEKLSWRVGYKFLAACTAVLLLPFTVFVVRSTPKEVGMRPYGDQENKADDLPTGENTATADHGMTLEAAVRTPAFYAVLLAAPCFSFIFGLTSHFPAYAASVGIDASWGALLTSASLLGGMSGKLTLGMIGDRFGAKTALIAAQSTVFIGEALMFGGAFFLPLLVPGAFAFGYGACTTALMPALLTSAVFGKVDYSRILTWFTMSSSLVGGFGSTIYGMLYDKSGTYRSSFIFCFSVAALCLSLGIFAINKRWQARN